MRELACSLLLFWYLSAWMLVANQGKLLCVPMFVYIYVCTHPHTHPQRVHAIMGMQIEKYPKFRLVCESKTTMPWVFSSFQLVFICQGNTEACSLLLLHTSVSAGRSHCGLQHTSLSGSEVLRTCVILQLDFGCRCCDRGVAIVLLNTRGRACGQAQDQDYCYCLALVYALSLSPKGQDHNKSETTVSQSNPKIIV